ncbi:hypothetical protein SS37A_12450 [Methylocystis iwaonis]|uniref:Uncharacterized protein n=1 Tax=Methylocystis iwaonis TaxID=2885079 RepID=A0ABM8E6X7_9HYPH|nr:hypothetical protein SS37A_12450 [Methylocystis iwaonis]
MERAILEKHLAEAEARVTLGARHLEQQRALILRLESNGYDSAEAKALLRLFEELQVEHVAHRDRLRSELGVPPPPE